MERFDFLVFQLYLLTLLMIRNWQPREEMEDDAACLMPQTVDVCGYFIRVFSFSVAIGDLKDHVCY